MSTVNVRQGQYANQRRSQRILLSVPVKVTGKRANGTKFEELTSTLIVNAHGALLQLREAVKEGNLVEVRNVVTNEELACMVVDVATASNGTFEVGVEFSIANPKFWRVSFPPADWSPRSPEAKRYSNGAGPAPAPAPAPSPLAAKPQLADKK